MAYKSRRHLHTPAQAQGFRAPGRNGDVTWHEQEHFVDTSTSFARLVTFVSTSGSGAGTEKKSPPSCSAFTPTRHTPAANIVAAIHESGGPGSGRDKNDAQMLPSKTSGSPASVGQLEESLGSEPRCCEFESRRWHQEGVFSPRVPMAINTSSIHSTAAAILKALKERPVATVRPVRERPPQPGTPDGTARAIRDRQRREPPPHVKERNDRIAHEHFVLWGCDDRDCALDHARKPLPTATALGQEKGIIAWLRRLWRNR